MATVSEQKRESLNYVQVALTVLEKFPKYFNNDTLPSFNDSFMNEFDFLMELCGVIGFTKDKMIQWFANYLTKNLLPLELAMKATFIAKLKDIISCSDDPRIPMKYRKSLSTTVSNDSNEDRGVLVNVESIDWLGILSTPPLSESGKFYFHSTEGINNIYGLARCLDFNAFLWFAINNGRFTNSYRITNMSDFQTKLGLSTNDKSLFGKVSLNNNKNKNKGLICGSTFVPTNNYNFVSMCIETKRSEDGNVDNTLVPVSTDWHSVNWYGDSRRYFVNGKNAVDRDFSLEKGICNIEFINNMDNADLEIINTQNNLKFTILPKPFVYTKSLKGTIDTTLNVSSFVKILFNSKGEPDQNGKFSITVDTGSRQSDGDYVYYTLKKSGNKLKINSKSSYYEVVDKSGYKPLNQIDLVKEDLYECYCGLTVYEFLYDYVMSQRLFDPKTIISRIYELAFGLSITTGYHAEIKRDTTDYRMRIAYAIREIMSNPSSVVKDCYSSFSNEAYDKMENEAELKRANGFSFNNGTSKISKPSLDEALNILNDLGNDSKTNTDTEIIQASFNKAFTSITDEVMPTERFRLECNLLSMMVTSMPQVMIESLLGPNFMLLMSVYQDMIGESDNPTLKGAFESLYKFIFGILNSVIQEMIENILYDLLNQILKEIRVLFAKYQEKIELERVQNYMELMNAILSYIKSFKGKRTNLESKLDEVSYADIDEVASKTEEELLDMQSC